MRNLSTNAKKAIFSSQTSEVFLTLLEIDHDTLTTPFRFVANNENIVSNGNTYYRSAFEYELPEDSSGTVAGMSITICNVDRQIIETIRTVTGTPTIAVSIVLASDPDTIEYGPLSFYLETSTYSALTISATLTSNAHMDDNCSVIKSTVKTMPGGHQ